MVERGHGRTCRNCAQAGVMCTHRGGDWSMSDRLKHGFGMRGGFRGESFSVASYVLGGAIAGVAFTFLWRLLIMQYTVDAGIFNDPVTVGIMFAALGGLAGYGIASTQWGDVSGGFRGEGTGRLPSWLLVLFGVIGAIGALMLSGESAGIDVFFTVPGLFWMLTGAVVVMGVAYYATGGRDAFTGGFRGGSFASYPGKWLMGLVAVVVLVFAVLWLMGVMNGTIQSVTGVLHY